ncbi:MAG: response regulator [Bacteroidota bacterium]
MKKKILIVDDLVENIQIIILIFEKYELNYVLYQATDGELAFLIARKTKPDIIISDWDMPNMNGVDLIKKLKKDKDLKGIPVIMATGVMTTVKHLQTALEAGAADYIRKPVDEVELVARTRSALNLAENNKKLLEQKNQELVENTLFLMRNNEFNVQITRNLKELSDKIDPKNNIALDMVEEISTSIDEKIKTDSWKRFEIAFNDVHDEFYKNLLDEFADLTSAEIKLSAFLKLGLNTKDIASILYITPESVKVSRSRLRKKLRLDANESLQAFFSKY